LRVSPTRATPSSVEARLSPATAAVLLAGVAFWVAFRLYTGIQLEDALITYRYASNLASGEGFVFNAGERVMGTTTPLLTLALGALGALFGPGRIPLISSILMIAAAAGAALLTGAALGRLGHPPGLRLFVVAALCFHPEIAWMATSGMETPLVLLFMAWSLHAAAGRRWTGAAAAAALLVLTRIDGLLWAAAIFVIIFLEDRPALIRNLAVAGALLLPWAGLAFLYFGSPIPHSVIAKLEIGPAFDPGGALHLEAFAAWAAPFLGASSPAGWAAGILFVAAAAMGAGRDKLTWLLIVFPLLYCLALYAGRAPLYFDWYLAPAAYAGLLAGGIGLWNLGRRLARWEGRVWRWTQLRRGAATLFLLLYFLLLGRGSLAMAGRQRDYQVNEDATRRAIGEWLAAKTPPGASVAMEAIGYQGFFAKRRVIDLAGLISPAVVEIRRSSWSNAEAFHRVLRDLAPDYIVLRTLEVEKNRHLHGGPLFETPQHAAYFKGRYREVKRFVAPLPEIWGETASLTIFERMAPPA